MTTNTDEPQVVTEKPAKASRPPQSKKKKVIILGVAAAGCAAAAVVLMPQKRIRATSLPPQPVQESTNSATDAPVAEIQSTESSPELLASDPFGADLAPQAGETIPASEVTEPQLPPNDQTSVGVTEEPAPGAAPVTDAPTLSAPQSADVTKLISDLKAISDGLPPLTDRVSVIEKKSDKIDDLERRIAALESALMAAGKSASVQDEKWAAPSPKPASLSATASTDKAIAEAAFRLHHGSFAPVGEREISTRISFEDPGNPVFDLTRVDAKTFALTVNDSVSMDRLPPVASPLRSARLVMNGKQRRFIYSGAGTTDATAALEPGAIVVNFKVSKPTVVASVTSDRSTINRTFPAGQSAQRTAPAIEAALIGSQPSPWQVQAITPTVAVIYNANDSTPVMQAVERGSMVSGCGVVREINPKDRQVLAGNCLIRAF